jgi:hypothetical protein
MKIAPVADVKAKLSSYVEACRDEPVHRDEERPAGRVARRGA